LDQDGDFTAVRRIPDVRLIERGQIFPGICQLKDGVSDDEEKKMILTTLKDRFPPCQNYAEDDQIVDFVKKVT